MTDPLTKLVIQIPCFNEEATLAQTILALPRERPGADTTEYLVPDDRKPSLPEFP